MPESRIRRKKKDSSALVENTHEPVQIGSPGWLAPTMVTFFILGLLWIVVFYIAGSSVPVMRDLNNLANIGVGFAMLGVGFALATKWQ